MHFLHLLIRIADALPDSTRLAVNLILVGGILQLAVRVPSPLAEGWRDRLFWLSLVCFGLGVFIFGRRSVLRWQKRRAEARNLSIVGKWASRD